MSGYINRSKIKEGHPYPPFRQTRYPKNHLIKESLVMNFDLGFLSIYLLYNCVFADGYLFVYVLSNKYLKLIKDLRVVAPPIVYHLRKEKLGSLNRKANEVINIFYIDP